MFVNLVIEENKWSKIKSSNEWLDLFRCLFKATIKNKTYSVNIVLSDDENISVLNRQFRKIDSPTNVLSFPQYSKEELKLLTNALIGDVILSYTTISNEAFTFSKDFSDRVSHLFIHGVLHLLGFNHDTEANRQKMEGVEIQILSQFSIKDPYLYL